MCFQNTCHPYANCIPGGKLLGGPGIGGAPYKTFGGGALHGGPGYGVAAPYGSGAGHIGGFGGPGAYRCQCRGGFIGNGYNCVGKKRFVNVRQC